MAPVEWAINAVIASIIPGIVKVGCNQLPDICAQRNIGYNAAVQLQNSAYAVG